MSEVRKMMVEKLATVKGVMNDKKVKRKSPLTRKKVCLSLKLS